MKKPVRKKPVANKKALAKRSVESVDYERGNVLLQNLIRGDAAIGLVSDLPKMEKQILTSLWAAATQGSALAFRRIADCALASFRTIGAFDGIVDAQAAKRPWSAPAKAVKADDAQLQTALRATFEAHRLGDASALIAFARLTRQSPANQALALKLLREKSKPRGEELTVLGNVLFWMEQREESARVQLRAAELGNLDAMFELSLYYAQGLGVPVDAQQAKQWLDAAADAGHPRALYNLGAAWASGANGKPDLKKAAKFYERAAGAGHGRAACTLGVMMLTKKLKGARAEAIRRLDQADALGHPVWEMLAAVGLDDPRG